MVALLRCLSLATSCERRGHGLLSNSAALGDRRSATTKQYSCRREAPFRAAMIQSRLRVTDCAPQASAYCFVHKASAGTGVLVCGAALATCQAWHNHRGLWTPMTDCAE